MKHLLFLLLCIATSASFACGNEYHVNSKGKLIEFGESYIKAESLKHGFDTTSLLVKRKYLLDRFKKGQGDFTDSSDYALIEMKIGSLKIAVPLLEKLSIIYPDEYNIAANLGTAYELAGKNELAYEFIAKAIKLNPDSHYGSEWIHLKILEQKMKTNPDYKQILDLKVIDLKSSFEPNGDELTSLYQLRHQLYYQLQERISFIAPQDPIISQLLIDEGDLIALSSIETSIGYYKLALRYSSANEQVVDERLKEIDQILFINFIEENWGTGVCIIITLGLLFLLIKRIVLRRRKRKNAIS